MTVPAAIAATDIVKRFGATRAVDRAGLTVASGELVALLGPSGSGKTTLLRIIAGFERPEAGTVEIGGRAVAGDGAWQEPERRNIGMVFQEGALFPHLSVADNVGFGEPGPGRVTTCLELVGLADRANAFPHELSGGERQRVALARALANQPEVVLLDEPFASLDATLRINLREEIAAILRSAGASALFVTHDQQEALSLADRVAVMRDGRIVQAGPPEEVYAEPASRWVAEFLGAADVIEGTATGGTVETDLGSFPADPALSGAVDVLVRPESVIVDASGCGDGRHDRASDDGAADCVSCRPATVVSRSFYGHEQVLRLELASGAEVRSRSATIRPWYRGDEVHVRVYGPVRVLAREG